MPWPTKRDDSLAATGLFDRGTTFLTLLSIGVQPVRRFRIICTLFLPLLDDFAQDRTMCIGVTATKTHWSIAFTVDNRDNLVQHTCWGLRAFDDIFAVAMWTPTKV